MALLSEETHGAFETVASKPAQHLLRSVREEDNPKTETKNGEREVIGGRNQFAEHVSSWVFLVNLVLSIRDTGFRCGITRAARRLWERGGWRCAQANRWPPGLLLSAPRAPP